MTRFTGILCAILCVTTTVSAQTAVYSDNPPKTSTIADGYSIESFREYLDSSPIDALEGIWEYPDDAVTLGIERFESDNYSVKFKYRIILLESAMRRALIPGSVIGYIIPTAQSDKAYVWLYSETDGDMQPTNPIKCAATVSNNDVITFSKPELKFKIRFNLSRIMPSLFKGLSITAEPVSKKHPLGFSKTYPLDKDTQSREIRYL